MKIKLDKYHYHELLHTIHLVRENIQDHIEDHPACRGKNSMLLIDQAQEALGKLYSITANKQDRL